MTTKYFILRQWKIDQDPSLSLQMHGYLTTSKKRWLMDKNDKNVGRFTDKEAESFLKNADRKTFYYHKVVAF